MSEEEENKYEQCLQLICLIMIVTAGAWILLGVIFQLVRQMKG